MASVPMAAGFLATSWAPGEEIQVKRLILDGSSEVDAELIEFGVLLTPAGVTPVLGDEANPDYHIIGGFAGSGIFNNQISLDRPFTIRVKKSQVMWLYASSWVGAPASDVNARLWIHYLEF